MSKHPLPYSRYPASNFIAHPFSIAEACLIASQLFPVSWSKHPRHHRGSMRNLSKPGVSVRPAGGSFNVFVSIQSQELYGSLARTILGVLKGMKIDPIPYE